MTDKTQTKAVSNAPLTDEEFAEKYNRGHKIIDFVGHKKIFFGISLAIIIIGIVCNVIFGTQLDIQFSGGATLKFSYSGEINQSELTDFIQVETTEDRITTTYAQDLMGDSGTTVTVQFSGNDSIKTDIQKNLESDLQKKYPDNNFKCLESNSVDASMGFSFLLKCLTAVAIAAVLMVLYVTIRFKKIGGLSAGVMALCCFVVYILPFKFPPHNPRFYGKRNFVRIIF